MSEDLSHVTGGPEFELERIQQDEEAARLRFEAQRERSRMTDGEAPNEDHELLTKLEAEWKDALKRLHLAREKRGS